MQNMSKIQKDNLIATLIGVVTLFFILSYSVQSHAEWDRNNESHDGNGWSMSANGVLTIDSNEGWIDFLRYGICDDFMWLAKDVVNELVIGKDVSSFRMYNLPHELPTPDFFSKEDILGYDASGRPYYDYPISINLLPLKISVESGNDTFREIDGLLINMETNELVMAELGAYDVKIPEGVTAITCGAFKAKRVRSVQFPSTIQSIGESAFLSCQNLKSITLPDSIIEIGAGSFDNCNNLSDVKLPLGLSSIEMSSFGRCAIQYIEIPSSVEKIENAAFARCKRLKQVVILGEVKEIGGGAFYGCSALNLIRLPQGIEFIGRGAFELCENLRTMILPDSLQQIGPEAFAGCSLSLLRIPDSLVISTYDNQMFEYQVNPYAKADKSFDLSSVDTVILSGSDYDFGYPAISHATNVYFLGNPSEDVGQILDENSVENIYCSDEFKFEWTRSTVASWVRQRLTILPADQINAWAETTINTTPVPTNTPKPIVTPRPTETPWPTPMPRPTASPIVTADQQKQSTDPIILLLIVSIVLIIAAMVLLYLKPWAKKKRRKKRKKMPQLPAAAQTQIEPEEAENPKQRE